MSAPTTTPTLPDAALPVAIDYAVRAYRDAIGTTISALTSVSGEDRDLVVTLEDEEARALAYIGIAVRATIADAEARGRAEALAEVDAAFEAVATADLEGRTPSAHALVVIGIERSQWRDGSGWWSCDRDTTTHESPHAAILAAAAALAGGDA